MNQFIFLNFILQTWEHNITQHQRIVCYSITGHYLQVAQQSYKVCGELESWISPPFMKIRPHVSNLHSICLISVGYHSELDIAIAFY